jgi:hypothetical protein
VQKVKYSTKTFYVLDLWTSDVKSAHFHQKVDSSFFQIRHLTDLHRVHRSSVTSLFAPIAIDPKQVQVPGPKAKQKTGKSKLILKSWFIFKKCSIAVKFSQKIGIKKTSTILKIPKYGLKICGELTNCTSLLCGSHIVKLIFNLNE